MNVSVRCSEFAAYKRVSGSKRNAMVMDECINFFFFVIYIIIIIILRRLQIL